VPVGQVGVNVTVVVQGKIVTVNGTVAEYPYCTLVATRLNE